MTMLAKALMHRVGRGPTGTCGSFLRRNSMRWVWRNVKNRRRVSKPYPQQRLLSDDYAMNSYPVDA